MTLNALLIGFPPFLITFKFVILYHALVNLPMLNDYYEIGNWVCIYIYICLIHSAWISSFQISFHSHKHGQQWHTSFVVLSCFDRFRVCHFFYTCCNINHVIVILTFLLVYVVSPFEPESHIDGDCISSTSNVVYKEVFQDVWTTVVCPKLLFMLSCFFIYVMDHGCLSSLHL